MVEFSGGPPRTGQDCRAQSSRCQVVPGTELWTRESQELRNLTLTRKFRHSRNYPPLLLPPLFGSPHPATKIANSSGNSRLRPAGSRMACIPVDRVRKVRGSSKPTLRWAQNASCCSRATYAPIRPRSVPGGARHRSGNYSTLAHVDASWIRSQKLYATTDLPGRVCRLDVGRVFAADAAKQRLQDGRALDPNSRCAAAPLLYLRVLCERGRDRRVQAVPSKLRQAFSLL